MNTDETKSNRVVLVNTLWIVGVLLAIIVVLVVVKWSIYPNFVDRVNFAASLSSLILAILAIVYAFYSNDAISGAVNRLESVAHRLSGNSETLGKAVSNLLVEVKPITEKLTAIQATLDANKAVPVAPAHAAAPVATANANPVNGAELVASVIDYFLRRSSWNGLKTLKACQLSAITNRAFNLRDLTAKDTVMTYDYAFAYMVAASSFGLFTHAVSGANNETINVTAMIIPVEKLDEVIQGFINHHTQGRPADAAALQAQLSSVLSFFA
jgi:hypothetical protein